MSTPWSIPYEEQTFTLDPNAEVAWPGMARWVSILSANFDTIYCEFKQGKSFTRLPKGILVPFPEQTEGMRFRNTGSVTVTFTASKGFLPIFDNRLVLLDGTLVTVQFDGTQPVASAPLEQGSTSFDVQVATVLVAGVDNVNGVELIDVQLIVAGGAGAIGMQIGGVNRAFAQTINSDTTNSYIMPGPRLIPAGIAVSIAMSGGGDKHACGSYNLL